MKSFQARGSHFSDFEFEELFDEDPPPLLLLLLGISRPFTHEREETTFGSENGFEGPRKTFFDEEEDDENPMKFPIAFVSVG